MSAHCYNYTQSKQKCSIHIVRVHILSRQHSLECKPNQYIYNGCGINICNVFMSIVFVYAYQLSREFKMENCPWQTVLQSAPESDRITSQSRCINLNSHYHKDST